MPLSNPATPSPASQLNSAVLSGLQSLAAGYQDHERAFLDFLPAASPLGALPWDERPTDLFRGRLILEHIGQIIRFVPELDQFRVWLGSSGWFNDVGGHRMRAYVAALSDWFRRVALTEAIADRAALSAKYNGAPPPRDEVKEVEGRIKAKLSAVDQLSSVAGINNAISVVKMDGPVTVPLSYWDANPELLGVNNGVLNVQTRQFTSGRSTDYVTKRMKVVYDPEATCPAWEAFIERVLPDPDVRAYVQRTVGYTLTGQTSDQRFYFLHGSGKNGKSVFINVLAEIFGDYAGKARREVIEESKTGSAAYTRDLALFPGARFLYGEETSAHGRLREDLIKSITAGDPITADPKFERPFTFKPVAKLWLCGNHKPVIEGTDVGIWRRVVLIPFTTTIPDEEQIPHEIMHSKLMSEASGILNWALKGLDEWKLGDIPRVILDALEDYRRDEDDLAEFITDRVIESPRDSVAKVDMYQAYRQWAIDNGVKTPWTQKRFTRRMSERKGWTMDAGRRNWLGRKLTPTDATV